MQGKDCTGGACTHLTTMPPVSESVPEVDTLIDDATQVSNAAETLKSEYMHHNPDKVVRNPLFI